MKALLKNITDIPGWVVLGLLLMPGILWLVHEYLPGSEPGLQHTGLFVFYLDFYSGLAGVANWFWVLLPYVLYWLVRLRPGAGQARDSMSLGLAALKGDLASINGLLDKGADINQQDSAGRTPLYLTSCNDRVEIVKQLLEAGAKVDIADKRSGFRPLHCSAKQGNAGITELLIRYGANVDAQSLQGETPLHLAVVNGHPAVVVILLKYLAKVEICDTQGKTPMQYAELNRNTEIAELIREHMSDTWAYLQLANS